MGKHKRLKRACDLNVGEKFRIGRGWYAVSYKRFGNVIADSLFVIPVTEMMKKRGNFNALKDNGLFDLGDNLLDVWVTPIGGEDPFPMKEFEEAGFDVPKLCVVGIEIEGSVAVEVYEERERRKNLRST